MMLMVAGVVAKEAKWTIFFLTLVLGLTFVRVPTAHAVEFGNIGGKPAYPQADNPRTQSIFIHHLEPLRTVTDGVLVVNYTNETKTMLVYATDSIISSGGTFGCAQLVDEKKGVGAWVTMGKTEVTLESGQTEIVPFSITPPLGGEVGENDGCIVIQEKTDETQKLDGENSAIALSFRTAIRLAVVLPGEVKKSVKILGYAAARSEDGNFILKPRVKNNGNVSLDATLDTYTRGLLGGAEVHHNQQSPLLRDVTSDWNIPYKRPFWGGWIKSYFTITYDSNTQNSLGDSQNLQLVTLRSEDIRFFSPPKPLALGIELGVLALLGAVIYLVKRKLFITVGKSRKTKKWRTITITQATDIQALAKSHNISWKRLAKVNHLKPPYILKPGDIIKVPDTDKVAERKKRRRSFNPHLNHKKLVENWRPGIIQSQVDIETLADDFGVSWKLLAKVNGLKPPYILKPGDMIRVPDDSGSTLPHKWPGTGPLSWLNRRRLTEGWVYNTVNAQSDGMVNSHLDIEAVAKYYGVPWKLFVKINNIKPPYILKPGDRLKVPPKTKIPKQN